MPEYGLSEQDKQDLQQIRSMLPAGDARLGKLDMLLGHQGTPPPPQNVIKPAPTGAKAWLNSLEGDVRTGSGFTVPGKILQMMGATGTDSGTTPETANKVASLPLGAIKAAQGVAEKDPLKAASGVLQAAEIPGAFVAPGGAKSAIEAIPSKTWAGKAFQKVMEVAGSSHVDENAAGQSAMELQQLASRGGQMPKVVRDFLRRVTDPQQPPLTYQEARDFYSNATRLSADETNRLTPVMKRAVGQFTQTLGKSLQQTASDAGAGDLYSQAMSNYKWGSRGEQAVGWLTKRALPIGVTGALAEELLRRVIKR